MACHLQIDADPDPAYHFDEDADPDPAYHFDADAASDPDPTFQFDADPCRSGSTTLELRKADSLAVLTDGYEGMGFLTLSKFYDFAISIPVFQYSGYVTF